jgi:hypothetical protein
MVFEKLLYMLNLQNVFVFYLLDYKVLKNYLFAMIMLQ